MKEISPTAIGNRCNFLELKELREENHLLSTKIQVLTDRCDELESQVSSMYFWKHEQNLVVRLYKGPNSDADW